MESDQNIKIAEWAGYTDIDCSEDGNHIIGRNPETCSINRLPDYENRDSDAVKLLPVFVSKGFDVELNCRESGCCVRYGKDNGGINSIQWVYADRKSTIAEAICCAAGRVI